MTAISRCAREEKRRKSKKKHIILNKGHDINAFQAKRNMREGEPNTAISSQHSIMAIKRVTHNATWLFSPRISGDRFLFALQGGSRVFLAGVCERGLSHEALWCPGVYIGEVKMCGLGREFGSRAKSCLHLDNILRVYFAVQMASRSRFPRALNRFPMIHFT